MNHIQLMYQHQPFKSAQSYISDTCQSNVSEKKEYRCTKSTRGSAAKIKRPILSKDDNSSCDSKDPFKVLTKVENVQVSRPVTPEIVCLDDNMIIKPSRFSAQPAKSRSGVFQSLQQLASTVHSKTQHDVCDETLAADLKQIIYGKTLDVELGEIASPIGRRGSSSSTEDETGGVDEEKVQSSTDDITSGFLQLTTDISKAAYQQTSGEQGSQESAMKMHKPSEVQTLSLQKFEEVKPVQQDKEHSDVLFSSYVQTKRHSYSEKRCTVVTKCITIGSQIDVHAADGGSVGEKLKKSSGGGVTKNVGKSQTEIAVQLEEDQITLSSESDNNARKKKKEDESKKVTGDAKSSEK